MSRVLDSILAPNEGGCGKEAGGAGRGRDAHGGAILTHAARLSAAFCVC